MSRSAHPWTLITALAATLALMLVGGCGDDTAPGDGGADTGTEDSSAGDSGASDTGIGDAEVDGGDCPTAGQTLCGDACVDLMTDSANCGSCGAVCGDSFCNMGACDGSCPGDTIACGVVCCPAAAGCADGGGSCATPPPACRADPPADGTACGDIEHTCVYPRCDAEGEVSARCESSSWVVTTAPCAEFACLEGSMNCNADQLCVATAGGALLVECRENVCDDMTIERSCACDLCPAGSICRVEGRNVSCNTCPSGGCA